MEGGWGETQGELEGGSDRQTWSIYIEWMDGISANKYYFKNCLCVCIMEKYEIKEFLNLPGFNYKLSSMSFMTQPS